MKKIDKNYYFRITRDEITKFGTIFAKHTSGSMERELKGDCSVFNFCRTLNTRPCFQLWKTEKDASCESEELTTIEKFIRKHGEPHEIEAWFGGDEEEPTKDFYPDWKSLTPLPDAPRPWAKKGERYVLMPNNPCNRDYKEGDICTLIKKGLTGSTEVMMPNGKTQHVAYSNLAKIPSETYAEEPADKLLAPSRRAMEDHLADLYNSEDPWFNKDLRQCEYQINTEQSHLDEERAIPDSSI